MGERGGSLPQPATYLYFFNYNVLHCLYKGEIKLKTETITLRISEEEKQKIMELAKEKDISVSQLIRELCKEIFKNTANNN